MAEMYEVKDPEHSFALAHSEVNSLFEWREWPVFVGIDMGMGQKS